jgi:hypothetical protein
MDNDDRGEFQALLSDAMAFYRQDVSTFTLGVWWQACAPFDLAQVRRALTAHALDADRGQYPPRPADIVRALQGTTVDRALMAWAQANEAAQRVGAYASVVFDDAATHAAISDCGGWTTFCRTDLDELPHLQRRFCEAHRMYTKQQAFPYSPRLVGDHEATNALRGHPVAHPVLIGNPHRCAAVLTGGTSARLRVTQSFGDVMERLAAPKETA